MGTASVQEIAQRLNSNRITVHSTIEQLIKKGLLFETRKGKKRFIVAEAPDVLHRILQRKSNELKLIENDLDSITKLLNSIQSNDRDFSNVRLYEGVDGFMKVLEETIRAKNELCVLTCGEFFAEDITQNYLRDYYKRLAENGVHSRIICSPGEYASIFQADQVKYKLQLRLLRLSSQCKAGFYLWDDNIMLKSFKDDRIVCTIIKNRDMAFFFRTIIFDLLWNAARPQA